ncbi:MAG: hypothetical protein KAT33_06155, partial [Bacteroidales bacterium]|nr:hypothetical protein [Bacteroidales bacterium]
HVAHKTGIHQHSRQTGFTSKIINRYPDIYRGVLKSKKYCNFPRTSLPAEPMAKPRAGRRSGLQIVCPYQDSKIKNKIDEFPIRKRRSRLFHTKII